jgi:hypothetical protein
MQVLFLASSAFLFATYALVLGVAEAVTLRATT